MDKGPLLLLTMLGRRSGVLHTVPVVYFDHSGGYLVVGTGVGGSKRTPEWFLNLQAAGRARIRIQERQHEVGAHVAGDAERAQLWGQIAPRHQVSPGSRHALAAPQC
jgi:deazaflavin-dependent oxidoreductase (nitroreductase family)